MIDNSGHHHFVRPISHGVKFIRITVYTIMISILCSLFWFVCAKAELVKVYLTLSRNLATGRAKQNVPIIMSHVYLNGDFQ